MTQKRVRNVEADCGEHISHYVKRLITLQKEVLLDIEGEFNGVTFHVTESSTQEELLAYFDVELKRKRKEYEESDAYKMRQKEKEIELKGLNEEAAILIDQLRTLDFSDYKKVLLWTKDFQPYSDRRGVLIPKDEILWLFAANGYKINANTKENFNKKDPENYARYIIGQALDGIEKIGAIHPMVVTFTERWEKEFSVKE